jgi:hypothetical protein
MGMPSHGERGDGEAAATHNAHLPKLFQIALRRSGNAIILARKSGIDPVDASYPKVSCRRKRLHAPAGEETNAYSEHQRT